MASPLRIRLLQDIAEIQTQPYPNIALYIKDEDISTGCLILTVKGYRLQFRLSLDAANRPYGLQSHTSQHQRRRPHLRLHLGHKNGLYVCVYFEGNCHSVVEFLL
jgi:hypothetical protein